MFSEKYDRGLFSKVRRVDPTLNQIPFETEIDDSEFVSVRQKKAPRFGVVSTNTSGDICRI